MTRSRPERFFFVHVMKTGGTTLAEHIHANFVESERYPTAEIRPERRQQYFMIDELLAHHREHPETRMYAGHFPFVASQLVDATHTLSLVREPVERTISALHHHRQHEPRLRDASLEEVYDDPWIFPIYIHNHQSKLFSMNESDKLESFMDVIAVDEERLRAAIANLAHVDVLGLQESFDDFTSLLASRFGWSLGRFAPRRRRDDALSVSPELEARIREDNAADLAFYDAARELVKTAQLRPRG